MLPEAIRAGILAMIDAARKNGYSYHVGWCAPPQTGESCDRVQVYLQTHAKYRLQ
jgi:hypothetical protein